MGAGIWGLEGYRGGCMPNVVYVHACPTLLMHICTVNMAEQFEGSQKHNSRGEAHNMRLLTDSAGT